MTDNNKTYEELESLIDYDIYQYSSNPNMPCDKVSLAGYIASDLTLRGYCKANRAQIRKDAAKEIIQLMKQVQKMFYDKEYVAIQNIISKKFDLEVDDE